MTDLNLACPRCEHALDQALRCRACDVTFPTVNGIPWLFAEPDSALAEWRTRIDYTTKHHRQQADDCRTALNGNPSPATRTRLERLAGAHEAHLEELGALLTPIIEKPVVGNLETHLALKTRLPGSQGLVSYAANLHRDWAWGGTENAVSCDLVAEALGNLTGKRLLVLGAGGGRLAYDLHQRLTPASTVALDLNPLLMLVAQAVSRGNAVTLTEFPLAPKRSEDTAVQRTLSAPAEVRPGFHLLLADALRTPFLPGSFDAVLTPWLVDIVEAPLPDTAARINHLLCNSGVWVSFGSLAFNQPDVSAALGFEEVMEVVTQTGFSIASTRETDVPYMNCPNSRHGRVESVVTFRAEKVEPANRPARHEALPDWIVRGNSPVPLTPAFQTQATTTRIYAFIMSMIDGKRSIKDMARLMEEQRLMQRKEAEVSLRTFFTTMLDESRTKPGF